jgi:hypothetical protein
MTEENQSPSDSFVERLYQAIGFALRNKYRRLVKDKPSPPISPLPPLTYDFDETFRFDATHNLLITVVIYYSPDEYLIRLDTEKLDQLRSVINDRITQHFNVDARPMSNLRIAHLVINSEIEQIIHSQKLFSTPLAFAIPHLTLEPTEKPKETKKPEQSGYLGWS